MLIEYMIGMFIEDGIAKMGGDHLNFIKTRAKLWTDREANYV